MRFTLAAFVLVGFSLGMGGITAIAIGGFVNYLRQ